MIVDNVGMSQVHHKRYIKRGEQELSKLEGQVARAKGTLKQGYRRREIGDNVIVECSISFGRTQATVIIGATPSDRTVNEPCYCCSPCLVAGQIITIMAEGDPDAADPDKKVYTEDSHYYADIHVCQSVSSSAPRRITVYEDISSGGQVASSERLVESHWVDAQMMRGAIFSDYQNHQEGDIVMVLVQPLYDFRPGRYGVYSPCINKRKIADEVIQDPVPTITEDFIESSGLSCQIAKDRAVWDEDTETEEVEEGDISKYYPFRVLPIKIKSCF